MKVLHVSQNYYPSKGGPQYTMQHLSEKLAAYYQDEVQVCTTNSMFGPETRLFKEITPANETLNQVEINRLPFNRWHYPLIEFGNKVCAKVTGAELPHAITKLRWGLDSPAMNKMMADTTADVIMATTIIYDFAGYPFWRHKTAAPKPFILYGAVHLHKALPPNSPLIARAKACDCYIANTNYEKDELVKYGVHQDKIVTAGTGIELSDFIVSADEISRFKLRHGIKETDVVIGYIGRLVKGKGVAVLLDAFRKLSAGNKRLKLLLAGGTTDYVPEIRKAIKEENLPVILIESFDEKMKAVLYNTLDIFVLASQSESFGVVFLEAWACKKPVVGSRMGAIQSLLSEGSDSLLFEPGNAANLQSVLQTLIDNPELRHKMGCRGYQKVTENFTWPKVVAKYRDAYLIGIENFKANNNNKR